MMFASGGSSGRKSLAHHASAKGGNLPESIGVSTPSNDVMKNKTIAIRRLCSLLFDQMYELSINESEEVINRLGVDLLSKVQDAAKKSKAHQNRSSSKKEGGRTSARLSLGRRQSPQASQKSRSKSNRVRPASQAAVSNAVDKRLALVLEKNESEEDNRFIHMGHAGVAGGPVRKSFCRLFFTLPSDDGMYDAFLNYRIPEFQSDQRRLDYLSFKRSDSNLPFTMLFCALCAVFVATRFYWSTGFIYYQLYPTALVSILCAILSATSLLAMTFNRVALLSFQYQISAMQGFHARIVRWYNSPYGQVADNLAVIFASLASSFYLITTAFIPPCEPTVTIWRTQWCNPVALSDSVPPEALILTMIIVILFQTMARGASHLSVAVSWFFVVVAINATMAIAHYEAYLWVDLELFFLICLSYELERQPLRQFVKTVRAIEEAEANSSLRLQLAAYEAIQAAEALESKRKMVRHIGHEIRTPLNVVGVGVDMLSKELALVTGGNLPNSIIDIVEGIQDASSAAIEVINELLMFEKLTAGMTSLECVPVNIVPYLDVAMKQHMLPARAKGITFEILPSLVQVDNRVQVNADPLKIAVVFRNIFSNAVKFSKSGGTITVRLSIVASERNEEVVEIAIKDEGAGLSAENLTRLFTEGVQFNANSLQAGGGSGLGLFITKGIVMLHNNGKIWAESAGEGKGCTFFVHLPLVVRQPGVALGDQLFESGEGEGRMSSHWASTLMESPS